MSERRPYTSYSTIPKLGLLIILGILDGILCNLVTIVPIRDDISAPLLTCWTCTHSLESPNDECVKMDNRQNMTKTECHLFEPFCMIRRLEADGKVKELERSCTKECDPGCHRYHSSKRCSFCCTQPLCNVANDTDTRQPVSLTILALLAACAFFHI